MTSDDSRLAEIHQIDYFLANLELAVEQGEIGRQAFERLSAPYLARRSELEAAAALEQEEASSPEPPFAEPEPEVTVASAPAVEPPARITTRPVSSAASDNTAPSSAAASGQGGEVDRLFDRGAPPGAAPWASKRSSFSLGRWIAYAGAALAVAAALVFALRGWGRFPPIVRLAGLIGATVVLYADGEWLRTKLSLPVAGSWLMGVGAALFLLDGYAILQWLNLSGPLPWAGVLLACSVGYWLTEKRLRNGWFGAAGAVLQVGFWWLLAYALGLGTIWATALLGVVAAVWAFASATIDPKGPFNALSRVLATGAIVLSALVAIAMTLQIPAAVSTALSVWPIAAAIVSAIAAAVVFDRARPSLRGRAVGAQVPLYVAVVILWALRSQPPEFAPGLDLLIVLLGITAADAWYAMWRNSVSFAIAAFVGWLLMWTGVAYELGLNYPLMIAATAGLGVASLIGGIAVTRVATRHSPKRRSYSGEVWQIGGALTALSAAVATAVLGGLPGFVGAWPLEPLPLRGLVGFIMAGVPELQAAYVLVAAWVLVATVLVWMLLPRAWTSAIVILFSFVVTTQVVSLVAPESQPAWHAMALVVVAAAWSQARDHLKLVGSIPYNGVVIFTRVMYVIGPLSALAVTLTTGAYQSYAFAALLAVVAAAWLADAVRAGSHLLFAPVPMFAIAAVTVAVWAATTVEMGAISGSITALAIAGLSLLGERSRGAWSIVVLASSAAAATVLAPLLMGSPGYLAVDLLLGSIVWALLAWAFSIPEVAGASVGLGVLAVAAFLAWLDPAPWVTIVVLSAISAALLAPRVVLRDSLSPMVARFTAAVAAAGLFALGTLCAIGLASYTNLSIASASWSSVNAAGLAIALLVTAVYVLVWTVAERAEVGLYIGLWLIVLAVLIGLDAAHIELAEAYLLPVAVYFGFVGILWSSRKEGRPVPVGTDLAVLMLGPVAALIIALGSTDVATIVQHGFWALGLALVTVVAGLLLRARILVFGGIAVLLVDTLWLGRHTVVGLPDLAWVGATVVVLLLAGAVYAARGPIGKMLSGSGHRFASWR